MKLSPASQQARYSRQNGHRPKQPESESGRFGQEHESAVWPFRIVTVLTNAPTIPESPQTRNKIRAKSLLGPVEAPKFSWCHCVHSVLCKSALRGLGWELLKLRSLISPLREILILQKYRLYTFNHVHICQVSPQLSCGDPGGGTRSGFIRGCAAPGSEPLPYFRESRTPKTYPILGKSHNPGHPKWSRL